MISVTLNRQDLERIRYAYSPLVVLASSFRLLHDPEYQSFQQRWVDEAQMATSGMDMPYLNAVIKPRNYMADFVTPTPLESVRDIEADFEQMRQTPADVIRKNIVTLDEINGDDPIRQQFMMYPHEMMECLIDEMRDYWQRTLARHWAQIQTVLENDILFQARTHVLCGVDCVLNGFAEYMRYIDGEIQITKRSTCYGEEYAFTPSGSGIQLVPTVFIGNWVSYQFESEWQPMILYGARGAGLWHRRDTPEPETALRAAFGDSRAALLSALITPAHTADLARRLGVTSGAVSQQLGKLAEAGLVENHRSGYRVYYRLSERGEKLMGLFG
jgi:DNA-binding transcriptional ArsR family regulator